MIINKIQESCIHQLSQLLDNNFVFLKTFNAEFSYIEVLLTIKILNRQRQKIKQTLLQLLIRVQHIKMNWYSVYPRDQTFVKDYGILSFAKNMGKNIGKIKIKT